MGIFGRKKQQSDPDAATSVAPDEGTQEQTPARGPKDRTQVDGLEGRLDLGSIWLRGIPGMQLRLETDRERQKVVGAHLVLADSQVQVQAFAAPKSTGIWEEIRDEIAQSLATAGGTAEEVEGPFGIELQARMPAQTSSGQASFSPVRFVGVDGPRWFFRAVMSGRAAVDPAVAEQLYTLMDDMVIIRGEVPMAPRELLELSLPVQPRADEDESGDDDGGGLDPFRRGPEITEIH